MEREQNMVIVSKRILWLAVMALSATLIYLYLSDHVLGRLMIIPLVENK